MTVCPKCNGTGISLNNKKARCSFCFGTGTTDRKVVPMTNEEWFCQLSTEEKAEVFANATYSTAEAPVGILVGGKEAEQKKWEMWLKAVHKE